MKRYAFIIISLMIISTLVLTSCSSFNAGISLTEDIEFNSNTEIKRLEELSLVKSSDDFGIDIFKEEILRDKDKNIIISPISLFTVFNILVSGAEGETKEQIKEVLGTKKSSDEKINDSMNNIINYLNNSERYENTGFTRIYNSIWIDDSFKVKSNFINLSKEYYDSDIFKEDFSNQNTIDNMNHWISKKSEGLINEPISQIDDETLMTIFNVLHFKGKWTNTFSKVNTKPEKFYMKSGDAIEVDIMNDERFMSYYEDDSIQVGAFNYYNGKMVILLPKKNIDEFVEDLDLERVNKYISSSEYIRAKVKIPAFNIEYKEDLINTLNNLGMTLPFDPQKANFDSIKDIETPLWIGQVLHNCVVNVDEEGTEAAALTAVAMAGSAPPPEEIKEFYANKPFVFVIQSNGNFTLFIGKVEKPI